MDFFNYRQNALYVEDVSVADIAKEFGTPCYVYSAATIDRHWQAYAEAFAKLDHLVCYAVKANSNLAILNRLANAGSGFDIVSGGELERVLKAGGDPAKVVFSGVGKSEYELTRALEVGIRCFNVESEGELFRLNSIASKMGVVAPVSIRVNPDVDAETHPYVATGLKENKFGIDINHAVEVYKKAQSMSNIEISGVDCHIGSQLTQIAPFIDSLTRLLDLVDQLARHDIHLKHLDLGGGIGIVYKNETPPHPREYASAVAEVLGDRPLQLILEPGRAMVGNAGILVTEIEYIKHGPEKNFAIVDAAMNDLLRPALYGAWQNIIPVQIDSHQPSLVYDIVGPVCETGDFLGKDRELAINPGDMLAVRSAGAYAFSMSSNYNTRPRACEVMVHRDQVHLVRARERVEALFQNEFIIEDENHGTASGT